MRSSDEVATGCDSALLKAHYTPHILREWMVSKSYSANADTHARRDYREINASAFLIVVPRDESMETRRNKP